MHARLKGFKLHARLQTRAEDALAASARRVAEIRIEREAEGAEAAARMAQARAATDAVKAEAARVAQLKRVAALLKPAELERKKLLTLLGWSVKKLLTLLTLCCAGA